MLERNLTHIQNGTNWLKNLSLFAVTCLLQFLMDSTELPYSNADIDEIPGGNTL